MRATSGTYDIALDHVRALAIFLVFTWHFLHGVTSGWPIARDYAPALFLLAPLEEGHTGVALFMTLSGYLFAKLLDGRTLDFPRFMANRLLRLLPLLLVVLAVEGTWIFLTGGNLERWLGNVASGWLLPSLPLGGWSITVELQFYLLLPLILALSRRHDGALLLLLLGAMLARLLWYWLTGEVQSLAYPTLVGRLDQFLLGILAFRHGNRLRGRHGLMLAVVSAFCLFYAYFNAQGGIFNTTRSALWVVLPSIEGLAYGVGIAYYHRSYQPGTGGVSAFVARVGCYSYSIYLWHLFFVVAMARFIDRHIQAIDGFAPALFWSSLCFLLLLPLAYLSYRYIEMPFLNLRRPYLGTRQ